MLYFIFISALCKLKRALLFCVYTSSVTDGKNLMFNLIWLLDVLCLYVFGHFISPKFLFYYIFIEYVYVYLLCFSRFYSSLSIIIVSLSFIVNCLLAASVLKYRVFYAGDLEFFWRGQ